MRFYLALLLFVLQLNASSSVRLSEIVNKLNEQLGISTNILYCQQPALLDDYLSLVNPVNQLIFTKPFNATQLAEQINKNLLFVLCANSLPYQKMQQLELQFQQAHFLFIIEETFNTTSWLQFVKYAWLQGYVNLLLYTLPTAELYRKRLFPNLELLPSSVKDYMSEVNLYDNLYGHEVRVAVYNNPPRSLIYENAKGERIFQGFFMRFLHQFLHNRNVSFVPLFMGNSSTRECIDALLHNRVDVCSDALGLNPTKYEMTQPIRINYANLVVANAQPMATYRYLVAPFKAEVWICLIIYMALIVGLISFIYWRQQRRWMFSKFLLEAINSLLFNSFSLKDLHGRTGYILVIIMFMAGFIFSTFYLGFLKSLLTTENFNAPIESFEQLVEANITILMDEYDKWLSENFHLSEILWQIIRIVPVDILNEHRSKFDQNYAYIFFVDRKDLYDYAQQYLRHARMRRIPVNFFFLYAGFPMRKTWFLKEHLSTAWLNAFNSGLHQKLTKDAEYETMRQGFYQFLITEYYEAQPLDLAYFVMPAISLALGYVMALLSFLVELLARRNRS